MCVMRINISVIVSSVCVCICDIKRFCICENARYNEKETQREKACVV